jgi:hypothetical protein
MQGATNDFRYMLQVVCIFLWLQRPELKHNEEIIDDLFGEN